MGIADFWPDNVPPIRRTCSRFVALSRDLPQLDDLRGSRARGLRRDPPASNGGSLGSPRIDIKGATRMFAPVGKRLAYRTATEEGGQSLALLLDGCLGKVHPEEGLHPEQTTRVAHWERGGSRPRASTA